MTIADLVAGALRELGVAPVVGDVPQALAALGLGVVNRILDGWNAEFGAIYAEQYHTFALAPGVDPHTIGPTGTWVLAARPVAIRAMAVDLGGGSFDPIWPREAAWYGGLSTPAQSITVPGAFYYNPTYPNGEIRFDGVPASAWSVRVETRNVFQAVTLTDDVSLPQGYQPALHGTLKEELSRMPMFSSAASAELEQAAAKARSIVFGRRLPPTYLRSDLVTSGGSYNYRTGRFE